MEGTSSEPNRVLPPSIKFVVVDACALIGAFFKDQERHEEIMACLSEAASKRMPVAPRVILLEMASVYCKKYQQGDEQGTSRRKLKETLHTTYAAARTWIGDNVEIMPRPARYGDFENQAVAIALRSVKKGLRFGTHDLLYVTLAYSLDTPTAIGEVMIVSTDKGLRKAAQGLGMGVFPPVGA